MLSWALRARHILKSNSYQKLTKLLSKGNFSTGEQKKSASARIGQPKRKQSTDLIRNSQKYRPDNVDKGPQAELEIKVCTRSTHLDHHSSSIENASISLFCS